MGRRGRLLARRVIRDSPKFGASILARSTYAVQSKYGTDPKHRLVTQHNPVGKPTLDPCNVLLLHGAAFEMVGHRLRGFGMLADEHDARSEPVEAVAGQWIPSIAPLGAHNFDQGIMVIAPGWMDGDTSWLIYDNQVIILVDYTNWKARNWWFMTMQCVLNDIPILYRRVDGYCLTIDTQTAFDNRLPLPLISR